MREGGGGDKLSLRALINLFCNLSVAVNFVIIACYPPPLLDISNTFYICKRTIYLHSVYYLFMLICRQERTNGNDVRARSYTRRSIIYIIVNGCARGALAAGWTRSRIYTYIRRHIQQHRRAVENLARGCCRLFRRARGG